MIVDDRLETVLQTQAAGQAGHHTQLRQLVDIVGRTPAAAWTDRHDDAVARIAALHHSIGDAGAAAVIGSSAIGSPHLVAHLVTMGPRTALTAIGNARITEAQWLQLVPALPIHARGALRHRRDLSPPVQALLGQLGVGDFVLSGPAGHVETVASEAVVVPIGPIAAQPAGREGIGAIVRRIEAFRRTRDSEERAQANAGERHLPVGQQATLFAAHAGAEPKTTRIDIATDGAGTIVAADGVDPAMLIGHAPFAPAGDAVAASVDAATLAAVRARRPIVAGALHLDGAARIAGAWRIDGVPMFGVDGGQFTGYRARLRRPGEAPAPEVPETAAASGADALHQLLHELRTPINAIQGFAELIQHQLIGPTPHQYRSLAASIAADAARMLAGFEDVERLVRLDTGRLTFAPATDLFDTDLGAVVARMIAQLDPLIGPREIRLRWSVPTDPVPVAMAAAELERTIWRLLATLVTAAAPGERLAFTLQATHDTARLSLTLPQSLAMHETTALFAPDLARGGPVATNPGANPGGMLGNGFALRLCQAEARAAGGTLDRPGGATSPILDLTLPLAASPALDHGAAGS